MKNVRALNIAFQEDGKFQDLTEHFQKHLKKDPEFLENVHSIIEDSIERNNQEVEVA